MGDALARYWPSLDNIGAGLRGGQYKYADTATGLAFTLTGYKFTDDIAVSGSISWNFDTSVISGKVDLRRAGVLVGTLNLRWVDSTANATATVTGSIRGHTLNARRVAP